ncbi:Lrp/AsnC family transcriptional regulator [Candidatus Woesearchaeota archaeon]|nr:Lrp/AsnC family transcriptional regulator [Candidatus Woesearchaeota archaeon]
MDEKELIFLSHLRENARVSLTKIAKQTGVPISTLFDRLKRYEEGFILKHTALIDFNKLGFNVMVKSLLKIPKDEKEKVVDYLQKNHNVNAISTVTNGYSLLIETIFRDLKGMEKFTEQLEEFNIEKKEDFFVIEDIKRESFLSQPELIGLIKEV